MDKIVQWHNEAIYGEPHHVAMNIEMAKELGKLDTLTYEEYSKMCNRMGVSAMRDETFYHKLSKS